MSMIKRSCNFDPCRDCRYSDLWDFDEDYSEYWCFLDMPPDECDGQPDELSDYEKYTRENPRE